MRTWTTTAVSANLKFQISYRIHTTSPKQTRQFRKIFRSREKLTRIVKVSGRNRKRERSRTLTIMTTSMMISTMVLMMSLTITRQHKAASRAGKSTYPQSNLRIKSQFSKWLRKKLKHRESRMIVSFRRHVWPGLRTVPVSALDTARSITPPGASIRALSLFGTSSVMTTMRRSLPSLSRSPIVSPVSRTIQTILRFSQVEP